MWEESSMTWWAALASDRSKVRKMTGLTVPSAISGHNWATMLETMAAVSGAGRARSEVAMMAARLARRALRLISAFTPLWRPMMTRRPAVLSTEMLEARYLAPMLS